MKKCFINSLPKAGTNLLQKCLVLFGYKMAGYLGSGLVIGKGVVPFSRRIFWSPLSPGYLVGIDTPVEISRYPVERKLRHVVQDQFVSGHIGYTVDLLTGILECGLSPIIIVRDPRAVLASFVPYVLKAKKHTLHGFFKQMNVEERYIAAMQGIKQEKVSLQPLRIRCQALDPWLKSNRVLHIRFEDLIGADGGGSDICQRQTLERICDWLEVPKDKIEFVMKNLFGPGSHTFRKGRIDSWRTELPTSIISMFEDELGDTLSLWGY